MSKYDAKELPLSTNKNIKEVQLKQINNENLTIQDYLSLGYQEVQIKLGGIELKSDCVYVSATKEDIIKYEIDGFINKNSNCYLGGANIKNSEYILEFPAYKEYFKIADDFGCGITLNYLVRAINIINPIPLNMMTNVFDLKKITEEESYEARRERRK